jgi:hypothetical protein
MDMARAPKPFTAGAGLVAALACLALPAAAPAATFCVASPSNCSGGSDQPTLQAAINAAQVNGNGKDVIRVGAGLFDGAGIVDGAGNPVQIIGEGSNKTAFSAPSNSGVQTMLDVQEPTSELQDLRVHVDNAAATSGIKLAGATATDVLVTNSLTDTVDGFSLSGSAEVDDSAVDLICPANLQCRGFFVTTGATPTIRDTYIAATVGVSAVGGDPTVRRTRVRATQGVVASGGSNVTVADTMIRVPGNQASNFQVAGLASAGNGTTHLEADRVTVSGDGSGYGVWNVPNGGAGNDATVDLQGSVIDNVQTDLRENHSGGATGSITVAWTGYRTGSTTGTIVGGGNNLNLTNVDPKLVDVGGQLMSPAHDSPLVDRGDPAFQPFLGGLDAVLNTRVRDGDATGGARVDLGALEYQRAAPVAKATGPATGLTGETLTFQDTGSSDPDPGEDVTYAWSFDDGATATGTSAQHAFATAGQHTATLKVTDPVGLTAQTTVTVTVSDPPAPPQPDPGPQPDPNPGPGPGPAPNVAPKLTNVWLAPKSFKPRKGKKGGTAIRLTLSETATLTFKVEKRSRKGRKLRWKKVGSFTRKVGAGKKTVIWDGKLAGKGLPKGSYRLTARAADAGGLKSAPLQARFAIKS